MRSLILASPLALLCIVFPLVSFSQSSLADPEPSHRPDHRIYLHYSDAQVLDISQNHPEKIKQLNYYYQDSWYVMENPNCLTCPSPNLNTFDVQEYEHLREWSRKNTIQLEYPGHYIVLKPRKELQEAYSTFQ